MSLFKAASTVSLLTLVSRITGLVRELLMASVFGVSAMTDAFNVAFRIPNLFRRVLGEGAFSQAFVPVLAATRAEEGDDGAKALIDHVGTLLAWTLLLLCIAGVLGAPWMVWAMASGMKQSPQGFDAAVTMTRWMFPYIGFMSLVALAGGILNTWKKFAVPAASPVLLNIALILSITLGAPLFAHHGIEPIYAQAAGVMLGGLLQLGIQVPALLRLGLLPRIGVRWAAIRAAWADPTTRKVARLMLPALLGVSVAQVSLLINTQIASHLATGSVSWITYADRLMELPTALLGVALGVVLMPQLASARAKQDDERYSAMLDWGLRLVVVLSVPCMVALLVFAKPLVAVLYHYGAFADRDVQQTTLALAGYGVGIVGIVAIKVLAPGYFAKHDMRTPMLIAVAVLVFTQMMNLVLVPYLQHAALTLSIGVGAVINATWLLVGLLRRGSYRPLPGWGRFALQVVAASALLAVLLAWGAQHFDWVEMKAQRLQRIGLLAAMMVAAAVLYFGALWAAGLKLRQLLRR
ncbi:MAG: murein biosynthesis integral membrane protein MurJ [Acidovorax sp. SCN 65-28]|uniref:murein biosynthesis integral membrane protein MurJ n=1 Tax=Acidovorax sp. TaxID=1872122 RepID=UPI00086B94FA|nr:murein biosynthesis integral membrane protein MurJ [Acidovorax sp.]MBN9628049.1 murein biosynthesis integral membrane protein MurJ [Acidovorax sp.]ODS79612.1 MAG: murein biosynthesis integral membrane protein MurJ [Acidovorax sp. SCN 65-28]OJU07832.1 MAG: murein biosynthesis integral membrane protein MurJ [Acidovorax sp. 65-7]